ncbi:Hypothetical protein FKW44_013131, partial [Caligus rogercresseyi]
MADFWPPTCGQFESGLNPLDFSVWSVWRVIPTRHLTQFDVATASHCRGLGHLAE